MQLVRRKERKREKSELYERIEAVDDASGAVLDCLLSDLPSVTLNEAHEILTNLGVVSEDDELCVIPSTLSELSEFDLASLATTVTIELNIEQLKINSRKRAELGLDDEADVVRWIVGTAVRSKEGTIKVNYGYACVFMVEDQYINVCLA